MRLILEIRYFFQFKNPRSSVQSSIKFEKSIIILLVILSILGMTTLISAYTYDIYKGDNVVFSILPIKFIKQFFFYLLAWFIYYITYRHFNIYYFKHIMLWLLIVFVGLVTVTAFAGISNGTSATRWLSLGFIVVQPAELGKIIFPLVFAYLLTQFKKVKLKLYNNFYHLFIISLILISVFMIFKKMPDTGTTLALALIVIGMASLANLSKPIENLLTVSFVLVITIGIIMIFFFPEVLTKLVTTSNFQSGRIITFLDPFKKIRAEGYQVVASVIAIAKGSILGRGLGNGTQKLGSLPEVDSDFIFANYAEELGLIGVIAIFIIFFTLFVKLVKKIILMNDQFLKLFAYGLLIGIYANIIINLGGISGAIPLSGVPLPFFSSGVTNLIITFFSFSLIQVCINTDRIMNNGDIVYWDLDDSIIEKKRINKMYKNVKNYKVNEKRKVLKIKKGEKINIDETKYKIVQKRDKKGK